MPPDDPLPPNLIYLNVNEPAPQQVAVDTATAHRAELNQVEVDRLRDELDEVKHNRGERRKYARHIFNVLIAWLTLVGYVILAAGFGYGFPKIVVVALWPVTDVTFNGAALFHLSDGVMIALLTTTTGSVIGVFLVVARFLFPQLPKGTAKV